MAFSVEDGSGVAGANSYLSVVDFKAYADARGHDYGASDSAIEHALVRATAWLDATYGPRFPGVPTHEAAQALRWPRKAGSFINGVFVTDAWSLTISDATGLPVANNGIPTEIKKAAAEAALRELNAPGSLAPDLERGGAIRSLRAGSVAIEYAATAPAGTTFLIIEGILTGLLGSTASAYSALAVRV